MNYLAHLLLAEDEPDVRVGSVLADFTRVANSRLVEAYGAHVARGVVAHRRLDSFTDSHPAVVDAVRCLFHRHRHAGRIVVDIVFDHFLSRHWSRFSQVSLGEFVETCHRVLRGVDESDERFPERFRLFARRIVEHNVLAAYVSLEGVGFALDRVSRRIACRNSVAEALPDIERHYGELEECFVRFFPDALAFAPGAHSDPLC